MTFPKDRTIPLMTTLTITLRERLNVQNNKY